MKILCRHCRYALGLLLALALLATLSANGALAKSPEDQKDRKSDGTSVAPTAQRAGGPGKSGNAGGADASKSTKDQATKKKVENKNADQVIDDLLKKSKPKAQGTSAKGSQATPTRGASSKSSTSKSINPRVAGTAPDLPKTKLQSEGQFVINRRGKVILGKKGAMPMFAFKGDGKKSPELPMILMPCRLVENAEKLVGQSGQRVTFIVTGQVFKYRGANHLLPTMLRRTIDRGNLKP